jgi:antitoxin YefM
MPIEITYTSLRENLASVLDRVVRDQDVAVVRRRGSEDVAMIPAAELAGLVETAHLLRSPKNAKRLLKALRRAERGEGKPSTIDKLRREVGLEASR